MENGGGTEREAEKTPQLLEKSVVTASLSFTGTFEPNFQLQWFPFGDS